MVKAFFLFFFFCIPLAFCDLIDYKILQEKLQEPPPQWMVEQIEEDLAPFKQWESIDPKIVRHIGKTHQEALNLIPIKIHARKVYAGGAYHNATSRLLLSALSALAREVDLPDMDFFFCQSDFYGKNKNHLDIDCPVFCVCKYKQNVNGILIPSFNELVTKSCEDHLDAKVRQGSEHYPWEVKKAIGFWRGRPTDVTIARDWMTFPRPQLVLLSQKFPYQLDAKFYSFNTRPLSRQMLQKNDLTSGHVPVQEHMAYKYLIDADGLSNGWSRCYWILLSNSLMFKHASPFMQWYYRLLTPWEHYVPVKRDFSDLIEKIDWAKNHDVEAKKIAQKATALAEENLSCEMRLVYLYHTLKIYASLLNKER